MGPFLYGGMGRGLPFISSTSWVIFTIFTNVTDLTQTLKERLRPLEKL